MLTLQTVLDRIRRHGWSFAEVERAIKAYGLPPINSFHEAQWQVLEIAL
jgi:hypothetical protein